MIRNLWERITYRINILAEYRPKSNTLWEKAWYNSDKGRKHTAAITKLSKVN